MVGIGSRPLVDARFTCVVTSSAMVVPVALTVTDSEGIGDVRESWRLSVGSWELARGDELDKGTGAGRVGGGLDVLPKVRTATVVVERPAFIAVPVMTSAVLAARPVMLSVLKQSTQIESWIYI